MWNRIQNALRQHVERLGWRQIILDYVQIAAGSVLLAVGYNLFLVPNGIVAGGISGLGVILNHLLGWPVGLVTLALNLPLFAAGLRWGGGLSTGVRTIVAVIIMSLTIDLTAHLIPAVTDSPLLYIAYGGLMDGVGLGLVLRAQGTTGGTDIIGRLVNRFTGLEISRAMFAANALIIGAAVAVFGLERALYGVMVAAVSSYAVDWLLSGGRRARQATIISDRWPQIRDALLKEMGRGVTVMPGQGAFTGMPRPVLICIITPREVAAVRRLVNQIDPRAFAIFGAVTEVYGEGFFPIDREV